MKKLISLLMALLLVLTGVLALAEATGDEGETPAVTASSEENAETAQDDANEVTEAPAERSLIGDGLLVTIIGLAGVFLVLILFFLMIKLMGKMLK